MAAPSLGYAIGLNVQGKDVFGKLGPQLSQNLANWSAKKERAAKEKQDKEDKILEKAMQMGDEALSVRYEGERQRTFNEFFNKLKDGLESDNTMRDYAQMFIDYQTKSNQLKLLSDKLSADEKTYFQNDAYIKPSVAKKIFGTPDLLTDEEKLVAKAFGYIDAGNNLFLVKPHERKPVNQTLAENKVDKDQLMSAIVQQNEERAKFKAAEDKAEKDAKASGQPYKRKEFDESVTQITFSDKAIPGYVQTKGNILTPEKTYFIKNIVNPLLDNDAFVENALIEYENKGNDLSTALNIAMAANGGNLEVAKAVVARDFVVENQYQPWADANAAFLEQNRKPVTSVSSNKTDTKKEVEGISDITYQPHWSTAGFAKLKTGWVGDAEEMYNMKKEGKLVQSSELIAGYGPTVEFAGGPTSETYTISGLGNINPVSLYYDVDSKNFRLSYNTTVSYSGMTVLADQKDVPLNKGQLNQIRGSLSAPFSKKIQAFDAALAKDGFPTTLEAAGGGAPSGSAGGGGKAKISGF
jgi:hypothetical protein